MSICKLIHIWKVHLLCVLLKLSVKYNNGKHNEIDNSLGCGVVKLVLFTVLTPAQFTAVTLMV